MVNLRGLERCIVTTLTCMFITTVWMGITLHRLDYQNRQLPNPYPKDPKIPSKSIGNIKNNFDIGATYEFSASLLSDKKNISNMFWKDTDFPNLPVWMKEYFIWHKQVTQQLNEENWQKYRYLILNCYRTDSRCGGVSDRLKPLPLMVLAAAISKPQPRIMYIHWDRPCDLEEFLVPNVLNWTIPNWMKEFQTQIPANYHISVKRASELLAKCQTKKAMILRTYAQDAQGGSQHYDSYLNQTGAFEKVYHDLFRFTFQPSPAIQHLMDTKMKEHGLVVGHYSVAHYRAEYGKEIDWHPHLTKPVFLQKVTLNALKCASELQLSQNQKEEQPIPIYFASDNSVALNYVRLLRQNYSYPIVTFDRVETTVLKLDELSYKYYDESTNNTVEIPAKPSDYYSTFVDLLIAGNGNCVTYGRGGFGRLASLLSYNSTCNKKHVKHFWPKACQGRPPFQDIPIPQGDSSDLVVIYE